MGMGATNTLDRLAASIGCLNGVQPTFKDCADVPNGGVLLSLPALLSQGLLHRLDDHFKLPKGYYSLCSIFILLAFMALARLKFVESLKYASPGEWGKLLGLDRVPEVRTLRDKFQHLSEHGQPKEWSAELCKNWMADAPHEAGILYVDGHTRVYHGSQTKLPRHYVARDKLCARATCDYWVNGLGGKPFFYINKAVDPGMLQVLEHDIIPRLEQDIPNQPTKEELEANPWLPRFTIIIDREGYSPGFMARMWANRIATITYIKNPGEDWPKEEFTSYSGNLESGAIIDLRLAERGTYIGKKIWVREVRRLRDNNVQGSIVSTNFVSDIVSSFVLIISRWCQENFFAYTRREFNLDRLIDYGLENISDTTKLINPKHREISSEINKLTNLLSKKKTEFGKITLDGEIESKKVEVYAGKKAEILEEMKTLEVKISEKKEERKNYPKHILFKDLPEEKKFQQLRTNGKHLIDTIKMIAYRAETAMASIVREKTPFHDSGTTRVLLREIYNSAVDLKVDDEKNILYVRLHHLANQCSDNAARYLCKELTETETKFPGSEYLIVYEMIS
jgi:hypothetical protein